MLLSLMESQSDCNTMLDAVMPHVPAVICELMVIYQKAPVSNVLIMQRCYYNVSSLTFFKCCRTHAASHINAVISSF